MFPSISAIKENSRIMLRGKWGKAIVITLFFFMCITLEMVLRDILMSLFKLQSLWSPLSIGDTTKYNLLSSLGVALISAIFYLLAIFPLLFGIIRWFWKLSEDERPVWDIFHYFSDFKTYVRAVKVILLLCAKTLLFVILAFIPFIFIRIITDPSIYDFFEISMPLFVSSLRPLSKIAAFFGFSISVILSFIYCGFYISLITDRHSSARNIVANGRIITKGLRANFIFLVFHFLPLFFSCLLILPILYVFPYFITSLTCLGRYVVFHKKTERKTQI